MARDRKLGFTLLELIVVIAIVGILIGLLIVGIQAAREAARKSACRENLRQIGMAAIAHHSMHRHYPTGGWGWGWQGEPDRGYGPRQPGGWLFGLLPFLEQSTLRNQGTGMAGDQKRAAIMQTAATPVSVFYCPSRRSATPYPFVNPKNCFFNIDRPNVLARTDYAANTGDSGPGLYGSGPATLSEGDRLPSSSSVSKSTGIVFRRSQVRSSQVVDGESKTYLAGEKNLEVLHYTTGAGLNDDQGVFVGYDRDTLRITGVPPAVDGIKLNDDQCFGSAHNSGFHVVLCDGSVQLIAYDIDPEVHRAFGNRADAPSAEKNPR
jgi:prepilin-type N-terminal cleavage/methylation domain-containing protein